MTIKLNIGAGWSKFDGYLNCDISPASKPDYVFDIEKDIWPFEDNSVEAVIAHHVFEHIGEGYFHMLKELYRVCKHDAIIDIWVPHYAHHNFYHDPTHRRPITPYGLSLFDKQHNYNSPAAASKLGLIFDVDFRIMSYEVRVDSRYQHLQGYPTQIVEEIALEKNNVIEEFRIKLQVIKWHPKHYMIYGLFLEVLKRQCNQEDIDHYMALDYSEEELRKVLMDSEEYTRIQETARDTEL